MRDRWNPAVAASILAACSVLACGGHDSAPPEDALDHNAADTEAETAQVDACIDRTGEADAERDATGPIPGYVDFQLRWYRLGSDSVTASAWFWDACECGDWTDVEADSFFDEQALEHIRRGQYTSYFVPTPAGCEPHRFRVVPHLGEAPLVADVPAMCFPSISSPAMSALVPPGRSMHVTWNAEGPAPGGSASVVLWNAAGTILFDESVPDDGEHWIPAGHVRASGMACVDVTRSVLVSPVGGLPCGRLEARYQDETCFTIR